MIESFHEILHLISIRMVLFSGITNMSYMMTPCLSQLYNMDSVEVQISELIRASTTMEKVKMVTRPRATIA